MCNLFSINCFSAAFFSRGWRWIYIYIFGTKIKLSSSSYAQNFYQKMVFIETIHRKLLCWNLFHICMIINTIKTKCCYVWSQRGSYSGCSLQLINISFLLWIDSNCPSWNWISFDNILAGRILQLWYTWDFESLILMFSDM